MCYGNLVLTIIGTSCFQTLFIEHFQHELFLGLDDNSLKPVIYVDESQCYSSYSFFPVCPCIFDDIGVNKRLRRHT